MLRLQSGIVMAGALALLVGCGAADAKEFQFVGVEKCRSCHKKELIGDQYGKWQKDVHAKAFETLKGDEALKIAKEKGLTVPPSQAKECLKCHVTAYGVEARLVPKPLDPGLGIQCESCHGPGKSYRKKTIMSDRKKAVARGMWEPEKDEKICTSCHNKDSPSWDPAKYKLANGSSVGFDFEQARKEIEHPIPKDVKGKYVELEKKLRAEKKARGEPLDEDEEEEDEDEE